MTYTYTSNISTDGGLINVAANTGSALWTIQNTGTNTCNIKSILAVPENTIATTVYPNFGAYIKPTQYTGNQETITWTTNSPPNLNCGTTPFIKTQTNPFTIAFINTAAVTTALPLKFNNSPIFKSLNSGYTPVINENESLLIQSADSIVNSFNTTVIVEISVTICAADNSIGFAKCITNSSNAFFINVPAGQGPIRVLNILVTKHNFWSTRTYTPFSLVFGNAISNISQLGIQQSTFSMDTTNPSSTVQIFKTTGYLTPGTKFGSIENTAPNSIRRFTSYMSSESSTFPVLFSSKTLTLFKAIQGNEIVLRSGEAISLIVDNNSFYPWAKLDFQINYTEITPTIGSSSSAYAFIM